jgi:hypothetical protein
MDFTGKLDQGIGHTGTGLVHGFWLVCKQERATDERTMKMVSHSQSVILSHPDVCLDNECAWTMGVDVNMCPQLLAPCQRLNHHLSSSTIVDDDKLLIAKAKSIRVCWETTCNNSKLYWLVPVPVYIAVLPENG